MTATLSAIASAIISATGLVNIDNGLIRREIDITDKHIVTSSYVLSENGTIFARGGREFSFILDGRSYDGFSEWEDIKAVTTGDSTSISMKLHGKNLSVEILYCTHPGFPGISKHITFRNTGRHRDLCLEAVDIESLLSSLSPIESWVMRQYARYKALGTYIGNWDDPLIVVHDNSKDMGIAIGNEALGVLKRTAVFEDGKSICAGLTRPGDTYPFRRWLHPGEEWTSPDVFTVLYENCRDPYHIVNTSVADYVRKHSGVRIERIEHKPMCVYNTWTPFGRNIDEKMIYELADAAAECGIEEFVIDDGWSINLDFNPERPEYLGDWVVDTAKFPNGLKPVFNHIKSLGMKPGLWISLATADKSSRVFREHQDWFVKDRDGRPTDLHNEDSHSSTACFGTDWYDYMKEKILFLNREYGLAYVKLDLAILVSAYVWDTARTGCYAKDHPLHKDRQESFDVTYRRCMQLFDELHSEAPDLFIDCTFETAGKFQLMDYGIAMHAEGNWLSNVGQSAPVGSLRVRNLAWGRTPALPPTSLVIGNLPMDDERFDLNIKSLAGTLPILLGDPRLLSKEQRREFRSWADWLRKMEEKHSYMSFRQDLPGFGEPQEGCWDGWARINTDSKSGGIAGVFRQGAKEESRTVVIPGLAPDRTYIVKKGCKGETVISASGQELADKGFTVTLPREYDGELFEITLQ